MKKKITYIFVLLVYRNTVDTIETIESIRAFFENYQVILVNSYYDKTSEMDFSKIAEKYDCDFISIENRGYSYGNNKGIAYCNEKYEYDFLVISNPDIIIKKFALEMDKTDFKDAVVYAPLIRTLSGKKQNPLWVIKNNFAERCMYAGFKKNKKLLIYIGIAINKTIRVVFNFCAAGIKKENYKIYAAHGSFMIFSKKAIEILGEVFDDNMFLFAEESYLAHRLEEAGIPIYYTKKIEILHKEDGSMKLSKINHYETVRHSVIYYYEKICKK